MNKLSLRHLVNFILFISLGIGHGLAFSASPQKESKLVAQARELVDTYYGNQSNLIRAAEFLERAYVANPNDSNAYVQAARITIMGGHIKFDNYEEGSFERYEALLDKAIELDAANGKAHILKAQVYEHQRRWGEELDELNKASILSANDPWVNIGFVSYYKEVNQPSEVLKKLNDAEARGPGTTASDRKAYISALNQLSTVRVLEENYDIRLRRYAALALKERYPTDAWTPLSYAETFIDYKLFEDAIFYAREALKTMNFGAGQLTLAAALYARAAQLDPGINAPTLTAPYILEANRYNFSQSTVIEYLVRRRGFNGSLDFLTPTLKKIIP